MATLTGKLVSETYKALLKMIDNDILTESEKQISDGYGQGTGIFIDDNGFIRASVFKVTGGSSSQFLKADGSLDSNSYLTAAAASALYLTRTQADGLYLAIGSTTSAIAEGSRLYFTTGRVLATTLTGFVSTAGTVTAADTILTAINKIWWNIENGGGGGGGYVPYTGATQNLNLGTYGLISDYIQFNLAPTSIPTTAGTMSWNAADGTADLKMGGANVTLQIGQEELVRVVNKTGANLLEANYQAVRISGAQGNRLKVDLAKADNDANSADTIGLVTETINNNAEGFVTAVGLVRNIDTTGDLQTETWADGDMLYLSAATAGKITNVKPEAPEHGVRMGYVVRAHKTQGQIYVKVDNGYELDELHNVLITDATDEDILFYNGVDSLWINKNIYSAINATDVGKSLLAILNADDTTPVTTKPRVIRINVDNTVDALDVGTQGYLPFYDDTDFYIDSPIFVDEDGKVIVNGETGFYDFTVIGELKADNLYVNTFSKIIAETTDDSLSFNTYDGTDWIQNLRLFNDGTIKQLIVTNTLIGTTSTGVLRAGTKADIETILGAPAISGSLTENYIPIATDVDSITDSIIYQDGTNLVINGTSSAYKLQVNGTFSADELYVFGTGRITPNLVNGYVTHSVINSSTFNNVLRLHKNQDIQQFKIINGIVYADDFGYLAKATSGQIIAGLGFVPYNSTNPDGYIAPGTFFATNPLIWDQFTNTISMSQASDLNNGWLSASDWTTFNNKGGGSVSSVSASVPTGFAISGSPITTSGTLAITFASGYSLPTTIKQSNWDDAYTFVAAFPTQTGNTGKYLTTDGSSLSWGTVTAGVSSFNTRTGAVTLTSTDVTTALGYTPVTQARTLTINGTTFDLSADRAWTVSAGSSARNVSTFTATAGQTTFTIAGGYTPNLVDVFLNGVRLTGVDFTATNGTTIVLTEGVRVNDIIDVVNYLNAATLGITGSGTSSYLARWTGTSSIGKSNLFENADGTVVLSGTSTSGTAGSGAGRGNLLLAGSTSNKITFNNNSTTINGFIYSDASELNISGSGYMLFQTGGSERLRILSTGLIGIGISSPSQQLSVEDTILIKDTQSSVSQLLFGDAASDFAGRIFYNHGSDAMQFFVNANERMRISSDGLIGIGLTSPDYALTISGSTDALSGIRIKNTNGVTSAPRLIIEQNNAQKMQMYAYGDSFVFNYTVTGGVNFYDGIVNKSRFLITGAGNIGIGIDNPLSITNGTTLHINGISSGFLTIGYGNTRYLTMLAVAGNSVISTTGSVNLIFEINEIERARFSNLGNLLIGTTSNVSKLSVQAGAASTSQPTVWMEQGGAAPYAFLSGCDAYHGIVFRGNPNVSNNYSVNPTDIMSFIEYGGDFRFYKKQPGLLTNQVRFNDGTIYAVNTSVQSISDIRTKENIVNSEQGLDVILKLRPVRYDFKSEFNEGKKNQLGFIAQEVELIFTDAVSEWKNDNDGIVYKTVGPSSLIPVLVKSIQQIDYKFETQAEKIARLETRVQQLEAK
jgi:hypothetical protein